jgi:hypothetical protein
VGDRLRWTKHDRENNIQNGQRFTIHEIDAVENAEIIDEQGNIRQVNLSGQQHLDYAWVSTVPRKTPAITFPYFIRANRHDRNVGEHLGNRIAASLTAYAPGNQQPDPRELEITTTINHLSRSTNAPKLANSTVAIRPRVHTERLGRAVGEIGTVVKQLEHRDAKQYQLTTANLHILGELESTIESQQRELQQARRHSVLGAIDNPHQPQPNRPVKKTTQNHQHPPTPTAISPKSSAPKES